ncbi:unnamed protein product [Rhizophagus irregularis]|nr:unnamed protein product [Rhizophagus irregularis]
MRTSHRVPKNQVSFSRSDGLPKYRNPKDSFSHSSGLPKYGKTKFHKFGCSDGLLKYRNPKDSFGRSGGLPKYGKTKFRSDVPKNGKIPRFVRVGFRVLKNRKIPKIQRKTKKPRFVRSGGLPKNENPKIYKDSCGRLPINKNSKIKIRFSFGWIGFDFGLWAFDSIGCDILGLWICIGCDISLAGFGSVSTLNFY